MAYNLPDAWDPGFVLPDNVQDEGLERRAFITKMLPRGTYDDSTDGTGGFVVPRYVQDEGTGQGTFTTRWQPSGSYSGPRIPNWLNQRPKVVRSQRLPGGGHQVVVQPLGDAPLPEPFETYGQKAAAGLIARVASLPAGQRQSVLKSILDRVDKTLWTRASDIFRRYMKQGMSPADALRQALARAMSTGIAAELIITGVRGSAPQANSLLGLGCYSCAAAPGAMGDAASCQSTPGFSWVYAAGGLPGHWARTPAGSADVPFCPGGPPPPGATTVDPTTAISRDHTLAGNPNLFYVGPFYFDTTKLSDRVWGSSDRSATVANRTAIPDVAFMSPDPAFALPPQPAGSPFQPLTGPVLAWLQARLTEAVDSSGKSDKPVHYADSSDVWGNWEPDAQHWFDAMGISPTTPVRQHVLAALKTASTPIARSKNPKTGADMVLHVQLQRFDLNKDWDPEKNPLMLKVWLSRVPDKSVWGALWNPMILINPLTALQAAASVTAGATGYLSDLACGVLKDPNGRTGATVAASTVAATYGIPPQAGAAGVAIAADACGKPPPPPLPPLIGQHSILPTVLLAGGAVLAVALLTRKERKLP